MLTQFLLQESKLEEYKVLMSNLQERNEGMEVIIQQFQGQVNNRHLSRRKCSSICHHCDR